MNAKKETRVVERRRVKTQMDLTSAIVGMGINTVPKEEIALVRNALWGQYQNNNNIGMIENSQKNHCYHNSILKSDKGRWKP